MDKIDAMLKDIENGNILKETRQSSSESVNQSAESDKIHTSTCFVCMSKIEEATENDNSKGK